MSSSIVVCGWGQVTQPKDASPPFLDPLDMMERAARDAATVAGQGALAAVDTLLLVRSQSRNLSDPCGELARRLGITPRRSSVSGIGGQVPQQLVNQAAGMLTRGEAEVVLICGAETFYPRGEHAVRGEMALMQGIPEDYASDDAVGSDELEQRHGLTLPIHGFPLFETALWARSGLSKRDWFARVGGMWAGFSEVAARHPNAWTRAPRTADDIITASADNRPICYPYTKRMVSLVTADIGAAIVVTTAERAARFRDGAGRVAYFLGGAYAKDRQRFMVDKADFTRSPAMAEATAKAQDRAGVNLDDLECFDLYSCFPCAVSVARRELGLAESDRRPLTTTGGLGFFGGPGSNYALHGIATLSEKIAAGEHQRGMATALGWFMHKYAAGVYSATPAATDLATFDREDDAHPSAGGRPIARTEQAEGPGVVETYTVIYGRDGTPQRSLIYGRTAAGLRFVANGVAEEVALLTGDDNQVGRAVRLRAAAGLNVATFA